MARWLRSIMWALALVCCLGLALPASAGEEETQGPTEAEMQKWMEMSSPGEQHALMEPLVGDWDCESWWWDTPDQVEPVKSTGSATFSWILDGHYLQQEFRGTFMGAEFQGIGLVAYDKVAGHYQSVWMDSMSTGMMYETGDIDETGKVFTFEGSYNDPMSGGVVEMRTVHTIESPDRHVVAMYHTGPGEEFKMGELVYTRR